MNFPTDIYLFLTILLTKMPTGQNAATFSISTSAKFGDSAKFFCNASTSSEQIIASFRQDKIVKAIATVRAPGVTVGETSPNTTVAGSGTNLYYSYTIHSLSCSNRGNYWCGVSTVSDGNPKSNILKLNVLGPPGRPNLQAPSGNLILGDTVTVFCESNVGKPAKNLELCIDSDGIDSTNPICSNGTELVEIENKCIFTQNVSQTFSVSEKTRRATCKVGSTTFKSEKSWNVYCPPGRPNLQAPSGNLILGDTVTAFCEGNVGKPAKKLHLCIGNSQNSQCVNGSEPVKQTDVCMFTQNVSLTVKLTKATIRATCNVGSNKSEQTWNVFYPVDSIMLFPSDDTWTLSRGSSKTFKCEALGNPQPTYKWQFFPKSSQDNRIYQGQSINLHSQQSGRYVCTATNTVRGVQYNMTKTLVVTVVEMPTDPLTTTQNPSATSPFQRATVAPATSDKQKIILGTIIPLIIIIIIVIICFILYKRRAKPTEIEEPPEKPRNNHSDVNMMNTKPDLVHSTGIEKKVPMYNNAFDLGGEEELNYIDDKPRSRKPVMPLHGSVSSYDTTLPCV